MKTKSKDKIEHYKMLYRAHHWLTKVEDVCFQFPGELSASEIQDLSRLKSSFALGIYNSENHSLSISEVVKARMQLKKEYEKDHCRI